MASWMVISQVMYNNPYIHVYVYVWLLCIISPQRCNLNMYNTDPNLFSCCYIRMCSIVLLDSSSGFGSIYRSNTKQTVCNVSLSTDTGSDTYVNILHMIYVNTTMYCSCFYQLFTRPICIAITRHLYNCTYTCAIHVQ